MAVRMDIVEFTKEIYDRLFPNSMVETPLGVVKIGENQYKKMGDKDHGNRQRLLGAMFQTLNDPLVIVKQQRMKDGGKESYLYAKSFIKKDAKNSDVVISVVVNKDNGQESANIAITTHQRNLEDVLKAIKNPDDIVFEKTNTTGINSGEPDVNSSSSQEQHPTSALSDKPAEKSSGERKR